MVWGGAVEVAAFAAMRPGCTLRVWAGPGDVLAGGSGMYTLMSRHGDGAWEINLCLSGSHYELMDIDEGVPPDDEDGSEGSDADTVSLSEGDAPDPSVCV